MRLDQVLEPGVLRAGLLQLSSPTLQVQQLEGQTQRSRWLRGCCQDQQQAWHADWVSSSTLRYQCRQLQQVLQAFLLTQRMGRRVQLFRKCPSASRACTLGVNWSAWRLRRRCCSPRSDEVTACWAPHFSRLLLGSTALLAGADPPAGCPLTCTSQLARARQGAAKCTSRRLPG